MHRLSRRQVFHHLTADDRFARALSRNLSSRQMCELAARVCDLLCSHSLMVVSACPPPHSNHAPGKFGSDEPWPHWVTNEELARDGILDADAPQLPFGHEPVS